MKTTSVFSKNVSAFNSGVRRIVNKGGTSSSKTISILQILLLIAQKRQESGVTISIVSETLPHLKLGAIRDFDRILKQEELFEGRDYELSNHIYTFGKSIIEFFSADIEKATGPRRDILYLNECNNISFKVVSELEQRTNQVIFYDYNPVELFWIEDQVLNLPSSEFVLIKSNYLDNQFLPRSIAKEIELKASRDPNYKRVHVDVEYGVYEGLIFQNWTMVDAMPPSRLVQYGMDFGFTNDPTTLYDVRLQAGQWWVDELLYQSGMTNPEIIRFLKSSPVGRDEIIADSAEPKTIEEIRRAGFFITPSVKGPDSIRAGIELIKSYPLNVTKRSVNLIKELRNYKWKTNKDGNSMNIPIDFFNHGIDPIRYVALKNAQPQKSAPARSWVG